MICNSHEQQPLVLFVLQRRNTIPSPLVPHAFPPPGHKVGRMNNLHTVLGTNNCSVRCRVKVTLSHGRGLPVHGAAPWLGHPSVQTMCTHRANQYQLRGKARPNTRFQCSFRKKIFYAHSYDHCHWKCYQSKGVLGKVCFRRSLPGPWVTCAQREEQ